jgi:hypothetical protein
MTGRAVVFGMVGLLVIVFWFAFGRTSGDGGVKTRFKEWGPQK